MVNIIKLLYKHFECKVFCNNQLTDSCGITIGVKQGCILSPFLFTVTTDWLMKVTTTDSRRGIRWTLTTYLVDLDYIDDISLLSSRQRDMQEKTDRLTATAPKLGLKVNTSKPKLMKMNHKSNDPVTINNSDIDEVSEFTYLGSKIATDRDSEKEVNSRITKANQSFAMLKNILKSKQVRTNAKLRIFNSNILSVLLTGAECWKLTNGIAPQNTYLPEQVLADDSHNLLA